MGNGDKAIDPVGDNHAHTVRDPISVRVSVNGTEYTDVLIASVPQGFIRIALRDKTEPWKFARDPSGSVLVQTIRGKVRVWRGDPLR